MPKLAKKVIKMAYLKGTATLETCYGTLAKKVIMTTCLDPAKKVILDVHGGVDPEEEGDHDRMPRPGERK